MDGQGVIRELLTTSFAKLKTWEGVETDLIRRYGNSKRSTVKRWVALAKNAAEELVNRASDIQNFALGNFINNPFFVGATGEAASKKLSVDAYLQVASCSVWLAVSAPTVFLMLHSFSCAG